MSDQRQQCFVSMSNHCLIDTLNADGLTSIGNESLTQVILRHPDAKQMSIDDAVQALQSTLVSKDVTEITEEKFDYALGELPPNQWKRKGTTESFKCSEHLSGSITAIYVRIGLKYYTFNDYCYLKHEDIVKKVLDCVSSNL